MLYENYRARMTKLAEILAAIKKFRILIISVCAVIIAVTASLLAVSGLVYDVEKCPASIAVGDNLPYSAGAIFNGIRYEFSAAGSDTWTDEQPRRPGEYLVRCVSKSVFGTDRYGSAHPFTVLPRTVNVTVEQTSIIYGDSPEVKAELCYGDKLLCTSFIFKDYSKQETEVKADAAGISVTDDEGNDVTSSYIFNTVESGISFTPREITIVVDDRPEVYGGVTYTCGGYEIQGGESALASGDYAAVMPVIFNGDAGEFDITPEVQIIKNDGGNLVNVTANYAINIISGKLTVEKRPVYVTTGSARKVYDGKAIVSEAYVLDENFPLVEGHRLEVTEVPSLTNAGEINNVVLFAVKDKDGSDVTANYSILYKEYGTLKVMPRPVTVRTSDERAVYDGNPHYSETFYVLELEQSSMFIEGDTPRVVSRTERTLAGRYANELSFVIYNSDGEDVTGNYLIDYVWGTIEIERRSIVIHTLDREWIYDGEAHSYNGHIVTEDGYALVDGHVTEASGLATVTDAGTVANSMIIGIYDADGNIVTDNYNIERVIPGSLKVLPRAVTVAAASAIKVYDGTPLTANSLEVTSETQLVEGHVLHGETQGSQTLKGYSDNVIVNFSEVTVTTADGKTDVTKNYALTQENGVLTVAARSILVRTAENHSLIYNGEEQYDINFTVYEENGALGVADGETAKADTQAGYTKEKNVQFGNDGEVCAFFNFFGVQIFRTSESGEEVPVTENYEIDYEFGTLKINPRPVTFVSGSKEFIYNGNNNGFTGHELYAESPFELVNGHVSKAESLTFVKNVSDSGAKNNLNITVFDGVDGEDVTTNYVVTLLDEGILTVKPRPLYAQTKNAEKVYDDTKLNSKEYYAEKGEIDYLIADPEENSGLVFGHTANSVDHKEITDVQFDKDENVVGVENTLTLKIYDGEEQTEQNDVSENYEVHYTYGELKILKRSVKYQTSTETFIYDGGKHFGSWKLIEGTLVEWHYDTSAKEAAYITDVKESGKENTIEVHILKRDEQEETVDVSINYQIEYDNGTLTVTERKIIVTANSKDKVYDGTPLTESGVTVTYGGSAEDENQQGLVKDHKATAKMTEESTVTNVTDEKGVANVIVQGSVEITSGETDVTENYEIVEYVDGKLVVTSRPITVKADDAEKVYDATALTCGTVTVTYTGDSTQKGLVSDHKATAKMTDKSTVTDVGSVDNVIVQDSVKITSGETDVTKNYDITTESGTLTITPRPVTVTTEDKDWVYDGNTHTHTVYKVAEATGNDDGLVSGQTHKVDTEKEIAEICDVVYKDGEVSYKENAFEIVITSGETPVTQNYKITYEYGKLVINPRPVTVTTEDKDWVYDGNTHTHTVYKVAEATGNDDGLVSGQTHKVDTEKEIAEICDVVYKDGEVSYIENAFEIVITSGETPVTQNYKITYEYGKLVINPRPVTVTTEDKDWVYDGNTHTHTVYAVAEATGNDDGLVSGQTHKVDTEKEIAEICDVVYKDGEVSYIENAFEIVITSGETPVTQNYKINYVYGKLQINPRQITVVAADGSKVYNGEAQFGGDFTTNSELGIVAGHKIEATTNESYIEANKYNVTVATDSASIFDAEGNDKTANYEIKYDESVVADFEITKRQITLKACDDSTVYNGVEQYGKAFEIVIGENSYDFAEGHKLHYATTNESYVNAGNENPVTIKQDSAIIFDAQGNPVTQNYEITYDSSEANLIIIRRDLYITTGSATKPYDGMPLTCNKYELGELTEETGLLQGHGISFVINGSQTNTGSSPNTVDTERFVIAEDLTGTEVTRNYYIIVSTGTLTVTDEASSDPIIKIESDKDVHVFLRSESYGNYNGTTEWDPAEEYGTTISYNGFEYSANYLTSLALQGAYTADTITITYLVNLYGAYLPYYLTATDNYRQTSDTAYTGDMVANVPYTPTYYSYDYLTNGALDLPAEFKQFESVYSQFVKNQYLNIDGETGEFLDAIISAQGFDGYSKDNASELYGLISSVAQYIRGAAKYNLLYDRQAVDTDNTVISFLTVKEGVCRHYASAATMLFRRLGIPARYTTGISANVKAGIPAQPTAGHAWVEVYIDGFGWVAVDVTGAAESGGGSSGGNATPKPKEIILKPQDSVKKFDGEPLFATALEDNDGLSYLKANGYNYKVTFGGSQTEVGKSDSSVEAFILYDANNKDVTREFNFKREKGVLEVITSTVIYVHTLGISKVYNGGLQTFGAGDYYCTSELDNFLMPQGYKVTLSGLENVGLTDVGVLTAEQFEKYVQDGIVTVKVTKDGAQVEADEVRLVFDVHFEIVPIVLTFTTNSVTRVYNGKELSDNDISRAFSGDSFVEGHRAVVTDYAKITDVGSVKNIILIDIIDGDGNSVKHNYSITDQFGTLTVLSD